MRSFKIALVANNIGNKQIVTLLIILILSITIINQQFTNALLDIYFNIKSVPIFNSFEEVCNNKEISVKTTTSNIHGNSLDEVCKKDVKNLSNFETINDFPNSFMKEEILLDVLRGRTVFIAPSLLSQRFQAIYEVKNHLEYPDRRNPSLLCYTIIKNLTNSNEIYFL